MAKIFEVYKCDLCGNIVETVQTGGGSLACCGQNMTLLAENTVDAAVEKHVPVIERGNGTVTVKVGSVAHPMEDAHYIQWVELLADGKSYTQFLKPGDAPEAVFNIDAKEITVREYCNLHGHWKAEG